MQRPSLPVVRELELRRTEARSSHVAAPPSASWRRGACVRRRCGRPRTV